MVMRPFVITFRVRRCKGSKCSSLTVREVWLILQDPAILAWELVNEARYANSEDAHPQATDAPMPTGDQLDTWTGDVASYLKTVDPNHLIIDGRYVQAFDLYNVSHKYSY